MSTILEVTNPFDQSLIGNVTYRTWDQLDHDLEVAQRLHQNKTAWLPPYKRAEILRKTASLMAARFD